MKNLIIALVALAVGSASFVWNAMRKQPKIGFAETGVLMSEFSEAIEAKKKFEASQKEWDTNLKTLNDSLMATMDTMKANYDKSSATAKDSLRGLLQKRNDDLQRYTNAVKKMSVDKEKELMEPVIKKINSHLDLWGKRNGYDIIFGTMSGGNILQANPEYNVTAIVLKDLNENYHDLPLADSIKGAALGSPGAKR